MSGTYFAGEFRKQGILKIFICNLKKGNSICQMQYTSLT